MKPPEPPDVGVRKGVIEIGARRLKCRHRSFAPAVHTMNRMTHLHRLTRSNRAVALIACVGAVITCVAARSPAAEASSAGPEMGLFRPGADGLEFFEKRIRPL